LENENNSPQQIPARKSNHDWILWTLFASVVVLSIAAMFAIDYFYANDPDAASVMTPAPKK
jgi:hypothetical protein